MERYSKGFRRGIRNAKAEFRHSEQDIRSYPAVRELLRKIVPDFDDRFSRYDSIIQDWHSVRVGIADLPLGNDFMENAGKLRKNFIDTYEDPKSKNYEPDLLIKLGPVLQQVTNLVSNSLR